MRSIGLWAAAAFAVLTTSTTGAQLQMQPAENTPPKALIVVGASYAKSWGTPALPGYTVVNRGVGGEETSAVLARFEREVIAAKPDSVILWGHINDIFRAPNGDMDAAARNAKENLKSMIAHARKSGIETIVVTEVTLSKPEGIMETMAALAGKVLGKQSYQERVNDRVREVNGFLRQHAAKHGLRLLDFERAFDNGKGFRRPEYGTEDGSHISPAGYAHLTGYARSVLEHGSARE